MTDKPAKPRAKKPKSTRRTLGALVLSFQSFVVFFATLAAFGLRVAPAEWVWSVGLALSVLTILTPAILGRPGSYAWGWALQLLVLSTGFWVWGMWFIGTIFLGMWAWAMVAGGTVDRARANLEKKRESLND